MQNGAFLIIKFLFHDIADFDGQPMKRAKMTLPHDIEISQIHVFGRISGNFWELSMLVHPDLTIKLEHSRHQWIQADRRCFVFGEFPGWIWEDLTLPNTTC